MLKEQLESKVSWNIQSSIETLEDKIEKKVSRSRKIKGKLEKYKKKYRIHLEGPNFYLKKVYKEYRENRRVNN